MKKNNMINDKKNLKERLLNFTEWNPNPIIELGLNEKITYLNLAARTQFPTLLTDKKDHPILQGIKHQIIEMMSDSMEIVIYAREISFSNNHYEQQIFAIPGGKSIFIFMTDITARKKAEDELKEMNVELERRVFERTMELNNQNQQLSLAKKKAEQLAEMADTANSAKSVFLSTMSHELRTPLNGVIGMTDLLENTTLTHEQRDYTETIRKSSDILLSLITDIMDYSTLESERLKLEFSDFKLDSLINEAVDFVTPQIQQKPITIHAVIEKNVPLKLNGDHGRIKQVLLSLLNNAIKFTERGSILLQVKFLGTNNNKHILLFEVIDTGIGIPDHIKQKLFKPFTPGDSTMSRKYGGSGLGLALCRRLTEAMEGSLSLESEVGKGSTFSLILPLALSTSLTAHV